MSLLLGRENVQLAAQAMQLASESRTTAGTEASDDAQQLEAEIARLENELKADRKMWRIASRIPQVLQL